MRNFFTPPKFEVEEKTQLAHQLYVILSIILILFIIATAIWIWIMPEATLRWLLLLGGMGGMCLVCLGLTRRGQTRQASVLIILITWGIATSLAVTAGGMRAPAVNAYLVIVFIAGLLLGARSGIITAVVCSLTELGLVYAGWVGILPPSAVRPSDLYIWTTTTVLLAIIIFLQYLTSSSVKKSMQKAQQELVERRHAETGLRESEEEYRQLFEQMLSGLMVCEVICDESGKPFDHRFVQGNPAFEKLTGRSVNDLIGKTSKDLSIGWPPDVLQRLYQVAMTGEPIEYERYNETLRRYYDTRVFSPRRGQFAHVFTEITQRKQAEKALSESRELLNAVIENTSDMIWSVDSEQFNLLTFNHSLSDYYLKERGIMIYRGMPQEELFPPGDFREFWRRCYQRALDEGPFTTEHTVSSGTHTLHLSLNLLKHHGVTFGVSVFGRDISEQKRAETAHRDAEERYRSLAEATFEGIVVTKNGIVIDANQQFLQMWGYELAEVLGKEITSFVIPDEQVILQQIIDEGKERIREYTALRKDGTLFIIEAHGRMIYQSEYPLRVTSIRDITERKRAQQNLIESEERFRTLFEQAAVGVVLTETKTGRYLMVNQKWCDFLGYTREELLGASFHAFTYPEDVQVNEKYNALLVAGKVGEYSIEKRYIRKDGSIVWGNLTVSPLWTPGSEPAVFYHIAIVQDITERKQAERALKESEERYRLIANNVLDVIWTMDLQGRITYASPSIIRLTGYMPEEIVSQNMQEILLKTLPALPSIQPLEIVRGEIEQPRKDGSKVWTEVSISGLYEESGRLIGFLGLSRDIHERKQMEEVQLKSEEKFSKVFLLGPGAMSINDMNDQSRFIDINETFQQITGYGRDEIIGRTPDELGLYADPLIRNEIINRFKMNGRFRNIEHRFRKKNGELGTGLLAAEVIEINGRQCAIVSNIEISELKQTREELERSLQQLHTLSMHLQTIREKERAAIAREIHDNLGQALTGLKMELYWLKEAQAKADRPDFTSELMQEKYISALKNVDATIDLVRTISTSLRPSILDTLGLVPALEWLAHDFEVRYGINCTFKANLKQEDFSQDFATAAFRICQESLTNVARHAHASDVKINLFSRKDQILLEVEDNGSGIMEEKIYWSNSLGIMGMKERAYAFTGTVDLKNSHAGGTRVSARFPMSEVFIQKTKI